jgi:hypothetical protein
MPRQRVPAAVVVVAVFHFIFGGFGLLTALCGAGFMLAAGGDLTSFAFTPEMKEQLEITQRLLNERAPFYKVVQVEGLVVGLVLSGLLIAAGVGLLRLRPWARLLSLIYAPVSIVQTLLGAFLTFAYVNPASQDAIRQTHFQFPQQAQAAQATAPVTMMFMILSVLLQLAYPAAVVIIMLLPSVVTAFHGKTARAEPEDYRDPDEAGDPGEPDGRFQAGGH